MADQDVPDVYIDNPITLNPTDLGYAVANTTTTPVDGSFKYAQIMKDRYKISVTVSSNDLVVAVTHENGDTPSATKPLYFRIGTTLRAVTAALTFTIVDGTDWFASGSTRFGGLIRGYFVYAVWDSNSSIVALSASPIPYGSLVSDFSATTTNEKHLYNYANFTTTDDVINIGYFEATLSLVATAHLWTVPTFTSINLKHAPTFITNILTWTPIWTNLTITSATVTARYVVSRRRVFRQVDVIWGASTAITGSVSYSLPFSQVGYGTTSANGIARLYDASAATSYPALSYLLTSTVLLGAQAAGGTYLTVALLSSTVPFTWATTDELGDSGWYFI